MYPIRNIAILLAIFSAVLGYSQDGPEEDSSDKYKYAKAVIINGDTVPEFQLGTARVFAPYRPKNAREQKRYTRMEHNVTRAYPYAQIASALIDEYENDLQSITKSDDQKKYMKLAEAELKAEFEAEVKKLTVSQGKILIKLIDRETGETSYELIRQLRNGFQAFLWQGLAKMFGTDLKAEYDPSGSDLMMESIVRRIEAGQLTIRQRKPMTQKAQQKLEKRKKRLYKKYGLAYEPG